MFRQFQAALNSALRIFCGGTLASLLIRAPILASA
jgi:hypothetical protein